MYRSLFLALAWCRVKLTGVSAQSGVDLLKIDLAAAIPIDEAEEGFDVGAARLVAKRAESLPELS